MTELGLEVSRWLLNPWFFIFPFCSLVILSVSPSFSLRIRCCVRRYWKSFALFLWVWWSRCWIDANTRERPSTSSLAFAAIPMTSQGGGGKESRGDSGLWTVVITTVLAWDLVRTWLLLVLLLYVYYSNKKKQSQ